MAFKSPGGFPPRTKNQQKPVNYSVKSVFLHSQKKGFEQKSDLQVFKCFLPRLFHGVHCSADCFQGSCKARKTNFFIARGMGSARFSTCTCSRPHARP